MKTDKNHTEEIAYAVRRTRPAVKCELGLTGQEIADKIGMTTRQGAVKKDKATRTTPTIPATLAFYDHETHADPAKRKRIVMLLNAEIKDSRYRFSLTEPDPFMANWWRCFAAETKFSLLEFDVLCQKCIVILDPFFARNDYFKEAIQPLEDALLRAGKNAWVLNSLWTMLQEAPSKDIVYEWGGISNDEVRDRLYEMGRRDLLGVLSIESNGKVQEDFVREMLYCSSDRQLVLVTNDPDIARKVMAVNRLRRKRDRNAMQIRVLGFDNPRRDDDSDEISIEECYSEWTRKTLNADASDVDDGFARLKEDAEFSLMMTKRVIEADNRERALKAQGGNNHDNEHLSGT